MQYEDDWTPIYAAVYGGNIDIVRKLARLNSTCLRNDEHLKPPMLFVAIHRNNSSLIELLVQLGCQNFDVRNASGASLLDDATKTGRSSCVKTLKLLGADYQTMEEVFSEPIIEDEAKDLRYRVYFRRSLSSRLISAWKEQQYQLSVCRRL